MHWVTFQISLKPSDPKLGQERPLRPASLPGLLLPFSLALSPVALRREPARGPTKEAVFLGLAVGQAKSTQLCFVLAFHHLWSGLFSGPPGGHSCPARERLGDQPSSEAGGSDSQVVTCPRALCQPREGAGGEAFRVYFLFRLKFPWVSWALTPP